MERMDKNNVEMYAYKYERNQCMLVLKRPNCRLLKATYTLIWGRHL